MITRKIMHEFLMNTDETGRFVVTSTRTGRKYFVEPIGDPHKKWGDVDPATKKVTGNYGNKYKGSVSEKESLITEENGFDNVQTLPPGVSPLLAIEQIDAKYPDKE